MTEPNYKAVTIERASTGEYRVGYFRYDSGLGEYQYTVFIGSCAQTMIFLPQLLFKAEAAEDAQDKRAESDAIGNMVLTDMREHPKKFVPKKDNK